MTVFVPREWIAGATREHRKAEDVIRGLSDDDVRGPSMLPGWSRGHVVTHIARNADAMRQMAEAARDGRSVLMYPGGADQRIGDIESGSVRPVAELVADVTESNAALEAEWSLLPDEIWTEGIGYRTAGAATLADFAFLRWRETAIHVIDLGAPGSDPAAQWRSLDPAYLDEEWRWTTPGLGERVPATHTLILAPGDRPSRAFGSGPETIVTRDPVPDLLAWITGRSPGPLELAPW